MVAVKQKLFAEVGLGGQVGGCNAVEEILEAGLPDIGLTVFKTFFFPVGITSLLANMPLQENSPRVPSRWFDGEI